MRANNAKHYYDENYFNVVDTKEKAYFLGLLYADGCNVNHPTTGELSITLQEEDSYILEKFKQVLKSDYPLENINKADKNSN